MSMNTTPKLKNSSTGKYDLDWEGTDGAGHVLSAQAGDIVSHATLTLAATSKPLPAAPAGASRVMLQLQGGTVTDSAWIRFDGDAATSADFVIRNAQDSVSNAEVVLSGTFTDIRVLGTANASTLVIWWLK